MSLLTFSLFCVDVFQLENCRGENFPVLTRSTLPQRRMDRSMFDTENHFLSRVYRIASVDFLCWLIKESVHSIWPLIQWINQLENETNFPLLLVLFSSLINHPVDFRSRPTLGIDRIRLIELDRWFPPSSTRPIIQSNRRSTQPNWNERTRRRRVCVNARRVKRKKRRSFSPAVTPFSVERRSSHWHIVLDEFRVNSSTQKNWFRFQVVPLVERRLAKVRLIWWMTKTRWSQIADLVSSRISCSYEKITRSLTRESTRSREDKRFGLNRLLNSRNRFSLSVKSDIFPFVIFIERERVSKSSR